MKIQLGMLVIYARDLVKSVEFYRQLGLDVPEPNSAQVAMVRMPSGVTLILTTHDVARRFDTGWTTAVRAGYQQMMEFVVDDDRDVDAVWHALTSAGYHGRTPPANINGPYAALIDDPDGNVVLVSADTATLSGNAG